MRGHALIAAAALLWATLGPVSRFLLRDGIDPLEISFWRATIAGALFATHALARRHRGVARRDLPATIAFALVGVTVFYLAFFRAVETGGAAIAAILLYTAPIWVAIGAAAWLGERLTRRKAVAIAMTLCGVVLVAAGTGGVRTAGGAAPTAVLWGLLSGLSYSVYYIFGKRYFVRYAPAMVLAVAMPVGALALLPLVTFAPKPAIAWALLVFIAAVPTYGAYLLYAAGLARVEATRAATVATIEPIAAAALAVAVWGEPMGIPALLGGCLVLAGVLVTTWGAPSGGRDADDQVGT